MAQGLQKGILAVVFTSFLFAIKNIIITVKYLENNKTVGLACVQLVVTSLFMILLIFFFVYIILTLKDEKETNKLTNLNSAQTPVGRGRNQDLYKDKITHQEEETQHCCKRNTSCIVVCASSMCIFYVLIFALGIALDRIIFG